MNLSGGTTKGQREPRRCGNEGVIRIPQSSSFTGNLLSDCIVSLPGHALAGSYSSAENQSVHSTGEVAMEIAIEICTTVVRNKG